MSKAIAPALAQEVTWEVVVKLNEKWFNVAVTGLAKGVVLGVVSCNIFTYDKIFMSAK